VAQKYQNFGVIWDNFAFDCEYLRIQQIQSENGVGNYDHSHICALNWVNFGPQTVKKNHSFDPLKINFLDALILVAKWWCPLKFSKTVENGQALLRHTSTKFNTVINLCYHCISKRTSFTAEKCPFSMLLLLASSASFLALSDSFFRNSKYSSHIWQSHKLHTTVPLINATWKQLLCKTNTSKTCYKLDHMQ